MPALTSDDPRYGDLVRGCNQRFIGAPDLVHVITTAEQARAAVQDAVDSDRRIAVRSGGHCQERLVDRDDVRVLLDLSELDAVELDEQRMAFAVGPGNRLVDLYRKLFKRWGVTVPGGSCPSVGVGGHVVGGAYGPLSRRHGYLVDFLRAVEVVTVDSDGRANLTVATDDPQDPNHDLWWAHTGGGGGNFGVVTRYWLATPGATGPEPATLLPRPPENVLQAAVAWPYADMKEDDFVRLCDNFMRWYERNNGTDQPTQDIYSGLLLPNRSGGGVLLNVQVDTAAPDYERLATEHIVGIADGVSVPPVVMAKHVLPWHRASLWDLMYSSGGLETRRSKVKAADLRAPYSQDQLRTAWRHLGDVGYANPGAAMMFVGCGGQMNTVASDATAIPQRSSILKLVFSTSWTDPAEDDTHLGWLRCFYRDVHADTGGVPVPNDVTDGTYINNPDTDLLDPTWNTSGVAWHELYYQDNYPRLQRIKAQWDPLGIFTHPLAIEPHRKDHS